MSKREIIANATKKLFNTHTSNYIFVYTPPKVGSTTLVSSLRVSLSNSYNVIHIHDEIMLSVLTGINNVKINDIIEYLYSEGKNVFVIDVYRTPIERKMSEFFEKISTYHFNNSEENINNYTVKRVSDRFNKLFPHLENGDHYFDKYNIINPIQFDFINKYTIQQQNGITYIKLRLCDSKLWGTILSKIFETDIVLITDYKTQSKCIGKLYDTFKKEYKLPINYFHIIQTCKYFNFYYNEEERLSYLNLWRDSLCDTFTPYTQQEYLFYINLCLENQYINDIQIEHYIDNGCICKFCIDKRREIFFRAKKGETCFEKIIHQDVINKEVSNRNKQIADVVKNKIQLVNSRKKYVNNKFKINLHPN